MSSSRRLLAIVSILFVASGATGLAYETIWFKRFGQVWGSSAMALASVVACFLFGLGLGAWLGGRFADASRRPVRAYAVCEGLIGLLALLVPLELAWLGDLAARIYPAVEELPLAGMGLRVLATLVVLLPPSLLMGATLPLLVRVFTLAGRPLGRAAAWLYATNSLGAAAGVCLAGFYLLPEVGIVWTNGLVVAVNLTICAGASLAARRWSPVVVADGTGGGRRVRLSWRAAGAAFASGLGSLVLQMVWARHLVLLLGGSTYAYSALLAVFIAGLGGGSLLFRLMPPTGDHALARWVSAATVVLLLSTLAGAWVMPDLARWVGDLQSLRSGILTNALVCGATAAALQGVPTLAMGFLFPAIVQAAGTLGGRTPAEAARTVGGVYAWNTAGSILGAFATTPFLLPLAGGHAATVLALGAYVALPLVLFGRAARARGPVLAAGLPGAVLVVAFGALWHPDPRETNLGLYLYGNSAYPEPMLQTKLLSFEEGPTSNVLVLEEQPGPAVTIRVNGKVDGGTGPDMKTQVGLALVPRLLRPEAARVLVIGFGTGTTAGTSLLFPGTTVDCVEIEPGMEAASPYFHSVNHAPEESDRFRFIVGDARAHVQGTSQRYDMIVSEPSNPWIAGVSNLFTREFFEAARTRLTRDGMLAQWVQTYCLSGEEFALVVRTMRSVFRDCAVFRLASGDVVLVASASGVLPAARTLESAQELVDASPEAQQDLTTYFGTTSVRGILLGHLLLDGQGILQLLRDNPGDTLNTDFNLRLEFDAPRYTFREDWGTAAHPRNRIAFPVDVALYQRLITEWGFGPWAVEALRRWVREYDRLGEHDVVRLFAHYANALSPDDPEFLATWLFHEPPLDLRQLHTKALRLAGLSRDQARDLAERYSQTGDQARANVVAEALREVESQ